MSTYSKRIIKGWKRLLLSEEKNQMKAAQEILMHINKLKRPDVIEKFLITIIDEDFVDFICRSMETWKFKLMSHMYRILLHLFETRKFLEYSRVVLVLDALMRNISNFYKMKPSATIFSVYLLTKLIAKTRQNSMKDAYRPEVLLKLIERLTNNQVYFSEIKSNIFNLTYVLLCDVIGNIPKKFNLEALKSLSFKAGISLYKEIEDSEPEGNKRNKAKLMCKMMTKILRSFTLDVKHNTKIAQHIMKSCISLSSFPKMDGCNTSTALRICDYFITIAVNFGEKFLLWLVKFITENGFLMFFLHHFQACGTNVKAKEHFLKMLQMCVKILSDGNKQKIEKIEYVVYEGLSNIPATSSCAFELEKPNFTNTQLAIVAILYYHFSKCTFVQEKLMISSPITNEVLLSESTILKIFSCIKSTNSFILKMLIFLYAFSTMDSKTTVNERIKHRGYQRLLKMINSTENLEELYSDHKIFIQWAVSSESLSRDFKACAITQWLSRRENEDTILDSIIERNSNVLSLLLMMLCSCKKEILGLIFKIFWKYQIKQSRRNDNRLQHKIWKNLVKVLDYYLGNPDKAHNLAAYMKLASIEYPPLKAQYMIHVASKLLKVMQTQIHNLNSLLTVAMFSLVKMLMSYFINKGEDRGVLIFFKTKVLINVFKMSMFHDDIHLACASAELLTFISTTQRENNLESDESIKIPLESIRKETTKSLIHSLNCVRLYNASSEMSKLKPFIAIEMIPEENRQKMCCKLYLNFLNISFMINNNNGEYYWLCMEKLLNDADAEEGSQSLHLWTASTVSILLNQPNSQFSSNQMLLFLEAWLTRLAPVVWRWSQLSFMYRSLLKQIEETATVLATKTIHQSTDIRSDTKEKDINIKLYKSIFRMILNLQIKLPVEIEKQLNKINNCM